MTVNETQKNVKETENYSRQTYTKSHFMYEKMGSNSFSYCVIEVAYLNKSHFMCVNNNSSDQDINVAFINCIMSIRKYSKAGKFTLRLFSFFSSIILIKIGFFNSFHKEFV